MRESHRTLIRHATRHMAFLAQEIEALDEDIAAMIRDANLTQPYELLQTIPGIRPRNAATILAESGPDMKQFPTAGELQFVVGRGSRQQRERRKKEAGARNERKPAHQDGAGGGGMVGVANPTFGIRRPLPENQAADRAQTRDCGFRASAGNQDLTKYSGTANPTTSRMTASPRVRSKDSSGIIPEG